MRKIKEVLRLKHEAGLSDRQIARSIGSSRSTVQECLRRVREAGIGWPLPAELDEVALIARLYRRVVPLTTVATPEFAAVHAELARRGVTRLLLWQEYRAANPEGLQYTAFCNGYRRSLADRSEALGEGRTARDVGELLEQRGAAVELHAPLPADRLEQSIRRAAPQERGDHHVRVENEPHAITSALVACVRAVRRARP